MVAHSVEEWRHPSATRADRVTAWFAVTGLLISGLLLLGQYVSCYWHVHCEEAELKAIMIEMLSNVLDSDHKFKHWLKT
ncbi:MAG TPA: hypothetical protein VMF50_07750 [Candidatus Binataceae bacterium]|nr:hypothetical protein [Candidatus Binataceae bacterium]